MKVLVATEKPFAKVAVDGIREVVEHTGYQLVLLEKYHSKDQLIEAVADVDALIIRSDNVDADVLDAAKNLKIVVRAGAGYDNIELFPYALWKENTTLNFSGGGGRQSALCPEGYEVRAVALDSILSDKKLTYIKAGVEGAEKEALEGMRKILTEQKPKLCISVYHRSADIFELIIAIHNINPHYKIHLRHHPYIPAWDTNIYCK